MRPLLRILLRLALLCAVGVAMWWGAWQLMWLWYEQVVRP